MIATSTRRTKSIESSEPFFSMGEDSTTADYWTMKELMTPALDQIDAVGKQEIVPLSGYSMYLMESNTSESKPFPPASSTTVNIKPLECESFPTDINPRHCDVASHKRKRGDNLLDLVIEQQFVRPSSRSRFDSSDQSNTECKPGWIENIVLGEAQDFPFQIENFGRFIMKSQLKHFTAEEKALSDTAAPEDSLFRLITRLSNSDGERNGIIPREVDVPAKQVEAAEVKEPPCQSFNQEVRLFEPRRFHELQESTEGHTVLSALTCQFDDLTESSYDSSEDDSMDLEDFADFVEDCGRKSGYNPLEKLHHAMMNSVNSMTALQNWDRANGLPKSHCQTMVNTSRSREQLQSGVLLQKWNGQPLLHLPGAKVKVVRRMFRGKKVIEIDDKSKVFPSTRL